jgi:hypothetical protein
MCTQAFTQVTRPQVFSKKMFLYSLQLISKSWSRFHEADSDEIYG